MCMGKELNKGIETKQNEAAVDVDFVSHCGPESSIDFACSEL